MSLVVPSAARWCESLKQAPLRGRVSKAPARARRGARMGCVGLQKGVCEEVWGTWSQLAFVISWLPSAVSAVLAYLLLRSLQCRGPGTLARKSRKANGLRPGPLAVWERHCVLTAQEVWGFLVGVSALLGWTARSPDSRRGACCLICRHKLSQPQ